MKYFLIFIKLFFFFIILHLFSSSCSKDKTLTGIDLELFELSKESTNFSYYKNSSEILAKSSGSGHPQPFLKTRYNQIAATQLSSSGKINPAAQFPEGSLIVKELYDASNKLERYAVLYKKSMDDNADANGWVWGYLNANGTVAVSASKKGESCISCHSQSDNIDYMLMNKYFP